MTPPFAASGGALLPWARSLCVYASVLFLDALALPMASTLYVAAMGNVYPPLLVAVSGAAATTLGSLAQYGIVRWLITLGPAQRGVLGRVRQQIERLGAGAPVATTAALFVVYATPLSAGPLRIIAAVSHFPLGRFTLAIALGCLPYYYALALLGRVVRVPLWILLPAVVAVGGLGVVHLARRWRDNALEDE